MHARFWLAAPLIVLGAASLGHAAQRTFVASGGLDTNPCSIIAPCRSFTAAIAQTGAGGEVIVQDSAGYGPVTITKAVSLIAPAGVYAGVTVTSGDGITINAPGAIVILRGLSINGQGGGIGIVLQQAARLRIESCVISNMVSNGVAHTAPGAEMIVLDTIVRDNGGTGIGIAADASVILDQVRSEHNHDGFYIIPTGVEARAVITNSIFAFNDVHGISIDTKDGAATYAQVDRSVLADNVVDGFASNGAPGRYSVSVVTRNAIHRNGGVGVNIVGGLSLANVSDNAFLANFGGIRADNAHIYASGNNIAIDVPQFLGFEHVNGGVFSTYRNNVGGFLTSGTLVTAVAQ